ncbi:YceI family protein [Flavobacteriaceae bacterium SZ-1-7]|uniref:YceI family protein n=1 Tax=Tamlana sedimenti TaxID=3134126 RepID=UPI00312B0E5E
MSIIRKINEPILTILAFLAISVNLTQAQEFKLNNPESSLKVLGTSSLHDWHVTAEQQSGKINFSDIEAGKIESLSVSIVAESLKSGKSSMDKNTYKALKTDDHKNISFQLTEVKDVVAKGNGAFSVKTMGNLTIVGTKKSISLDFEMNLVGSKIKISGDKKIKMTDFNIDPPKALFGTITTGDDITIEFTTVFK